MRRIIMAVAGLATLAACSAEKPVSNEEAVPLLMEQTVGLTPDAMLKRLSGQVIDQLQDFALGFAGDKKDEWDKKRFETELDAAYAPLADQINQGFAAKVAERMEKGQGARMLAMLDDEGTAAVLKCAFSPETGPQDDPWAHCEEKTEKTASEEAKKAFNSFAGLMADVMSKDDTMAAAMGYATCGVIAKFGKDVSRDGLSISFDTTEVGPTGNKRRCPAYDKLAAEKLTGDLPPNFAAEADKEAAGIAAE